MNDFLGKSDLVWFIPLHIIKSQTMAGHPNETKTYRDVRRQLISECFGIDNKVRKSDPGLAAPGYPAKRPGGSGGTGKARPGWAQPF